MSKSSRRQSAQVVISAVTREIGVPPPERDAAQVSLCFIANSFSPLTIEISAAKQDAMSARGGASGPLSRLINSAIFAPSPCNSMVTPLVSL